MEKKKYTVPIFEIIQFEKKAVITTSGDDWDLPPLFGLMEAQIGEGGRWNE